MGKTRERMTWTHPFLHEILDIIPVNVESLIDVGCGKGIIGALVRIYRNPKRLVGLDVFPEYVQFCRKFEMYDETYLFDLKKSPLPFEEKEFECLTCIEVIEHLRKSDGEKLIAELERIAKIVILTTPSHPTLSKSFDNNPSNKHLSFWSQREFYERGYKVKGVGNYAIPIWNIPIKFRHVNSRFPHLFQFLLAKKE